MNALLERLGRFASRHRWWVVGVWLLLLVGLTLANRAAAGNFVNDYTVPGSQSSNGLDVLRKDFSSASGYSGQIVFHAEQGTVEDQSKAVSTTMKNVGGLDHVISATDPLTAQGTPAVSKDGTIAYGTASWDVVPASLDQDYLDELDKAVEPARSAGLVVDYGGGAGQIGQAPDDAVSELIGLGSALVLLLIMFGSIVAALIPLVGAVFSVGTGLALVGLVAAAINLPTTAPTVATLLGLGVAVDYGLFLVARHREQLDHGMDLDESIGRTTATSGAAVVVAGSTVVVAILGLYVSSVPFVGALGLASAIVVAVTMLSALTLVPAFLALARNRVRSRSDRADLRAHVANADHTHENSAFARWGRKVSDKPWPWAVGSVLLLLVLAIPVLSLRLGQLDAGSDPTSQSDRRAYDLISQGFGDGANGPLTVVLKLPQGSQQQTQDFLSSAQKKLAKTSGVASAGAPTTNPAGTVAVINLVPTTAPDDAKTSDLVDDLKDTVLPGLGADASYVVGTTAGYVDFTEKVGQRMIWLILAVVLLSLVLLTIAFRSLVISVKAAILNLLSVGAAYGVVVAVFQWGWGSQLLGIDQDLPIPAFVPMLMFAIVFGLSMDYEVFLLSRVREAWHQTGDAHRAVAIGIGSTARVITTAAAIMVVVFSSFVLDTDPTIKMLAVGMAVAVLIDASVVRMVLVPALMSILGARAWWLPRWLDRVIPDLQLEGSVEPVVAAPEPAVPSRRP
ncbi:MMPL family transporter [Nocardioides sp. MAHUQ-72]|uniref:MMPL family transporter n=1 Tax=unclassified Nocardioides TaxID=2615069 RepID=UPI00360BF5EB